MSEENQPASAELGADGAKSKNQLKNDKKREEKMAKFLAKQEKMKASVTSAPTKAQPKTLNIKTEVVEDRTIPGEKKGISLCI